MAKCSHIHTLPRIYYPSICSHRRNHHRCSIRSHKYSHQHHCKCTAKDNRRLGCMRCSNIPSHRRSRRRCNNRRDSCIRCSSIRSHCRSRRRCSIRSHKYSHQHHCKCTVKDNRRLGCMRCSNIPSHRRSRRRCNNRRDSCIRCSSIRSHCRNHRYCNIGSHKYIHQHHCKCTAKDNRRLCCTRCSSIPNHRHSHRSRSMHRDSYMCNYCQNRKRMAKNKHIHRE
jgi:hypothetical protein